MKLQEIKAIAGSMGIKAGNIKKDELIPICIQDETIYNLATEVIYGKNSTVHR